MIIRYNTDIQPIQGSESVAQIKLKLQKLQESLCGLVKLQIKNQDNYNCFNMS